MFDEDLIYRPGRQIGNYTIKKFIGKGTHGQVYLVEWETDEGIKKNAAAKILIAPKFKTILRETANWGRVSSHKNILHLIGSEIIDEKIWMFSDYIERGSLKDWLKRRERKNLTYRDYIRFFLGILNGLDHLHKLDTLHRDLKPANILLKENGPNYIKNDIPLLADFGLARNLAISQTETLIGTKLYNSPEWMEIYIARNEGEEAKFKRSKHDDLWAVGVIFQELLTGKHPFETIENIRHCRRTAISSDVPKSIRDFCDRQLQKERSARFQSVSDMINAIKLIDAELDDYSCDNEINFENKKQINEAKKYFLLASKCLERDFDCLITNYSKAIEINSEYAVAYVNRGIAYKNKGNHKKAIEDYTKAIELKPEYAVAYNYRANSYYYLGFYEEAIKNYSKAIKLKPDYSDAFNSRASVYAFLKNYEEAIRDYTKAIELNPSDPVFYKNRAKVYEKLGMKKQALKDIKIAEELI